VTGDQSANQLVKLHSAQGGELPEMMEILSNAVRARGYSFERHRPAARGERQMIDPQSVDMSLRQVQQDRRETIQLTFLSLAQPVKRPAPDAELGIELMDMRLQLFRIRARCP
jgi:hypothetical protein